MLALFTDFGADDIYVGQVKTALLERLPAAMPIVDLLHRAPDFRVQAAAHLLAALQDRFPLGTVLLAVVDPGVGTAREAIVLEADGKIYVGPDNGLLSVIAARAAHRQIWRIAWRPARSSVSFHGRDLFAPIAAEIARGAFPADKTEPTARLQVELDAHDLAEVIYVDHYGNALTGLRARDVSRSTVIAVGEHRLCYARVFGEVPVGRAFWYENSIGLVELAANRASAAALLGLAVGDPVTMIA